MSDHVARFKAGKMKLEIHSSRQAAGAAAARAAAEELRRLDRLNDSLGVIFATGASQFETLDALTSIPGLPWDKVQGFHMDEYVGIDENHPASFRRYLRERLTQRVAMRHFYEMDGNAADIDLFAREYIQKLDLANPKLCLLGIGENGHLAFNDPSEADFDDPQAIKVVSLDDVCRRQQVSEGWFASLDAVPKQALTLTIPTLFRLPKLIVSVPGSRKAQVVRRTIEESISTQCPSTLLRTHDDVTIYLDPDSASEIQKLASSH
ncbi:MAG TPA: glucosamine-6-phosphate deaminase [Terracidiphilus sp.]|nr:glucosamine-6-phosphate deaminase [Terracidiphilus sp.]